MASSQDWIFSKAHIDELDRTELINNVAGRRKNLISRTIWLMEDITKALKLDRKVMTTAAVYFHRFFMYHSFNDQNRLPVAVACLFLASKVEEKPIKIKDIVSGFHSVYKKAPEMDFLKQVLVSERILLNTLGFELNVAHPLLVCGTKLKDLRGYATDENNKAIYQSAVNFINDSYRSTLCLQHSFIEIGMSLLFLATVQVGVKPVSTTASSSSSTTPRTPSDTTWLDLLSKEVDEDIIRAVCVQQLTFYESEAFMMAPKALESLRRAAYEQLGIPLGPSDETVSFSPSQSTDLDVDSYDRLFEKEESAGGAVRRVTVFSTTSTGVKPMSPQSTACIPPNDTPSDGCYPDESPLHLPPPPPAESPSSTPSFADLPGMRARERAASISDDPFYPSGESKRARY
jgi:hypothetical protein